MHHTFRHSKHVLTLLPPILTLTWLILQLKARTAIMEKWANILLTPKRMYKGRHTHTDEEYGTSCEKQHTR